MGMKRVELFSSDDIDLVESAINQWFRDNANCEIRDVKFSASGQIEGNIIYCAVIFYE